MDPGDVWGGSSQDTYDSLLGHRRWQQVLGCYRSLRE